MIFFALLQWTISLEVVLVEIFENELIPLKALKLLSLLKNYLVAFINYFITFFM